MEQTVFSLPAMPEMEFHISKIELDAHSPLNQHEAHIHRSCEVYINLSGDVSFAVENRLYPVSRGSVIITRPFECHHCIYHSDAPHEHYWITFSAEGVHSFLGMFFNREKGVDNRIVLQEPDLRELCGVLEGLRSGGNDPLFRWTGILQFFQILSRGSAASQGEVLTQLPPDVRLALEYMDSHLEEELDVEKLAKVCYISVNTLERHFKAYLGETPVAVIRKKRLFASMMLLRSGASVTDAARKSGFTDYSHYIQLFRKRFGMTPGSYKKLLTGEEG